MPTIKFSLNDEYYRKLETAAENKGMTIQDYIRYKLFDLNTIFTVEEAVRRVQVGDFKDKPFSLPDLYGDAWTLEGGWLAFSERISIITFLNTPSLASELRVMTKTRREIYTYERRFNP